MFRFRPSQCDALHLDYWVNGINVLRDGGTYSYNAGEQYIDYYGGVQGHNVIEFDGHPQMPRLSRFLLARWLKTRWKSGLADGAPYSYGASYSDQFGCCHKRVVKLTANGLRVVDSISGVKEKAVLRWRLKPGNWHKSDTVFETDNYSIRVISSTRIVRADIVNGYESRYYYKQTRLPVIEVEVAESCEITTELYLK